MDATLAAQIATDATALIGTSGTTISVNGTDIDGIVLSGYQDAAINGGDVAGSVKRALVTTSDLEAISGYGIGNAVIIGGSNYTLARIERSGYGWAALVLSL